MAFVSYRFFRSDSNPPISQIKTGEYLSASSIELPNSEKTLLIFVSEKCKFCRESVSFYQKLISTRNNTKSIKIVAVFPEAEKENDGFFLKQGVEFPSVINADFGEVGIAYTPTILLVNKDNKIVQSWIGKLSIENESKIFESLN